MRLPPRGREGEYEAGRPGQPLHRPRVLVSAALGRRRNERSRNGEDPLNVGSLFSGIGGLDEGLRRAGHRHVFLCESDPWRRQVLSARFPGVPIYEDVRNVPHRRGGDAIGSLPQIDLLCGGFP